MKRFAAIITTMLFAFALSFSFAIVDSVYAGDSDTVIYDAAVFANLSGRTQAEIMEAYTDAQAQGATYLSGVPASYYDVPVSLSAPYAAGVLSSDTLKAMKGMSNFYRWLIGVESLSVNTESNASLQAQAFDRNFEFNHYISNSSKPEDMDDDLWQEGFACTHNILASGYNPTGAVYGWINEGYNAGTGKWDTVGHRTSILSSGYMNISYGYSGHIAIGKCGSGGNTFANAFAAFPAAGYMPAQLVSKREASWTVQLNSSKVKATNYDDVEITVKNLTTGSSYMCTEAAGTAQVSSNLLNFKQPTDATGSYYTDSYKVTATGLTDTATGNPATITYTVHFFQISTISSFSLSQTKYAYTGSEIKPEVTVTSGSSTLVKERDYTVTYHNNVEAGTGIVEVHGIGNYCGVTKKTFTIEVDQKNMSQCDISLSPSSGRYNGKEIKPTPTVKSFGNTLTKGRDYEVSYRDNINAGTGVVIVSGIGEYSGSAEKTFLIYKGWQYIDFDIRDSIIEVDDTMKITASARENAAITFSSSDEEIATVDSDGNVHALKDGEVRITIEAAETDNYMSDSTILCLTVSSDIHTMEDINVIYADNNNDKATVTRKCSVCGKEETTQFTTMRQFWLWYWSGLTGWSYVDLSQTEGNEYSISLMENYEPENAEDTTIVLETSNPDIMTVDADSFKFVGAGTVTLTVYAKYRPTAKITHTFTVSHKFDSGTVVRQSTCSTKGEKRYTCTGCGATKTEELALNPNRHTGETIIKNAKEATCSEAGYTGDTCCKGCNKVLQSGSTIPIDPDAHNWSETTYTWADDNSAVTATRVCGNNDSHRETETATASWEVTKDANCIEKGEIKYTSAAFENNAFAVQTKTEVIPANPEDPNAHDWDDGVISTESQCGDAEVVTYTCNKCDKTRKVAVNETGHTPAAAAEENKVDATCTEDGSCDAVVYCDVCNAELSREHVVINASGHNLPLEHKPGKDATCTEDGYSESWHCTKCGNYFSDENGNTVTTAASLVIPSPGHQWEPDKTAAGLLTDGAEYNTCTVCGIKEITKILPGYANYYVKKLKIKKGKKSFTVKWKKQTKANQKKFGGYQIRYSLNSNMSGSKTATAGKKSKSKKIKGLQKKKTYYVQVRTFTVKGGKTYYSTWSPKKSVKVK